MEDKIFTLRRFYGLNECPDGDTKLRLGEASECRNFAVTRDGNLRRRKGSRSLCELSPGKAVQGLWAGMIRGKAVTAAICGGELFTLKKNSEGGLDKTFIGKIDSSESCSFFGFSNILYILSGSEYYEFDGESLKTVSGYRPLAAITIKPDGAFETLEKINLLTEKRRGWLSPDGKANSFKLPEGELKSLDYVKDLKTGLELGKDQYSAQLDEGRLTFNFSPPEAVNSYEAGWSVKKNYREKVTKMRYFELYNGAQDTRVFLYGDGTNKLRYSGLDYEGRPRADYFPDLNEAAVGDENSPVTALIRHFSSLLCFKQDSLWSLRYGEIQLQDGLKTAAFYSSPVNRSLGNQAPGQVQLILNHPYSLSGSDIYIWKSTAPYGAHLQSEERMAERVSDRVYKSLGEMELKSCRCFCDNYDQEYYVCGENCCLVYNYAVDAWYKYEGIQIRALVRSGGRLLFGDDSGRIKELSYRWKNDDGRAIEAYFESGAMSFRSQNRRKFSGQLWVGIKPESQAELYVSAQTDRRAGFEERKIVSSLASLYPVDFAHWSFATNRKPQIHRIKLKAKKFVYYKLVFRCRSAHSAATVLASDIRLRFTGYAK